jgi:FMN phosphatase YigB (HAD superfamily)
MTHEKENTASIPMLNHELLADIGFVILDMDGTLFVLGGEGKKTMTSDPQYINRTRQFIMNHEVVEDESEANCILASVRGEDGGVSLGLSERYNIPRKEVRHFVWDMDLEGIVKNFELQVQAVRMLAAQGKTMILLTSAPPIWTEKVLNYLNLTDVFRRRYDGDMYPEKKDAFRYLARKFDPAHTVSIGDQMDTDIIPAHNVGMHVFLVTSPESLLGLVAGT